MIIFKQWRLWVSLLLLIGSYIFIKPNFESQTSDSKINFGLDIQGGFSYLLELNEEEYLNNLLVKTSQYIKKKLKLQAKSILESCHFRINVPTNKNNKDL